jgi:hypothetical protein
MEDILDLYQLPYDPAIPMICMDEKPYQLLDNAREPLPMRQGSCTKVDSEYIRYGTASIFLFCEPLAPWCHVAALPHRTALDWAAQIKELLTVHYPDAPLIRLVMDNLNTHVVASLYKAFPAAEARAMAKRLEIHYTPKHGSWLNIAECYLSTLSRQCLNRRLVTLDLLNSELSAWEEAHRSLNRSVRWHFTIDDARVKLRSLYPMVL